MSLFNFSGGGDIWSSAGFAFVSPINDILDKDSFTLEEILAQDEVLQEVKSLNIKLVDFLSKESSVRDMMSYLADPPPEGAPDNRVFKFPYMSCEIICCEVPEILKAIANDGAVGGDDCPLRKLFSILDGEGDIDSHRAGYLEKVLTVLLKHRCGATTAFVNERGLDLFRRMVRHLGNFSVMQVAKLLLLPKYAALQDIDATALMGDGRGVGGSEDGGGPPASLWCNWSDDPEILKTLLAEFNRQPKAEGLSGDAKGEGGGGDGGGEAEGGPEKREESGESSDMHLHLSELLLALIAQSSPESSFLQRIFSEEAVGPLVAAATLTKEQGRQAEGSQAALQILAALADRLVQPLPPSMSPLANENTEMQMDLTEGFGVGEIGDGAAEGGQGPGIAAGGLRPQEFLKVDGAVLERGLSDIVPSLCAYLRGHTEDPSTITAQTKQEQPRLGLLRLQVVRFLETLVRMDSPVIDQVLIRESAMATCLEMMFTYETSSMLHASVATCVQAILAPPIRGGAPGISRVGLGGGGGLASPTSPSSEAGVAEEGEGEEAGDRKEGSPAGGLDSAGGGGAGGGGGDGDGVSKAGRGRRESFQRHMFEDCRLMERILEAVALNEDAEKAQHEQAPMEGSETEPSTEAAAEAAAEGSVAAAAPEGGGAGGDGGDDEDGELADAAATATPERGQTTGGEDAGVEAVASATAAAETAAGAEAPEAVAGAAREAPAEEGGGAGEGGAAVGGDDGTAVAADSAAAGGSGGGTGTGAGRRRSRPGRRLGHMGHVLLLSRAVMGAESGGGGQGVSSPRPSLAAEGGMLDEGGDGGDAAGDAASGGEGGDSGEAAAGEAAVGTAPGKKTFVAGLLAERDCAEHWQEFVRTTVAAEVSRQMNPLGGFAVPSREDENQLSSDFPDEAVDMDDTSGLLENMNRMQTAASGAGEGGGVGGLPPAPEGSFLDDDDGDDDDEEFGTGGTGGAGGTGGTGGSNAGGGGDNSLAMMFGSNFMSAAGGGSAWGSLAGEPGSSTATGAGSIGGSAFGSTAGDSSASVTEGWANFADFGDVQQSASGGGGGGGGGSSSGSSGAAGGGGFANFDPVFAIDAPAPPGPSGFAPSPPSWAPRVGDSGAMGDGGSGAGSSGGEGGFADFPQYGGFADFSAMMDDTMPSPPEPPAAASPAFDGGSGGGGGGGSGDGGAGGEDRMDEEAEDREDGPGVSSLGTAAAVAGVAGVGLSMSTSPRENKCDSLDAMMGSDEEEEEGDQQQQQKQQKESDGAGAGEQRP